MEGVLWMKEGAKLQKKTLVPRVAVGLFCVLFGLVLIQVLFFNSAYGYSFLLQVALLCAWGAVLLGLGVAGLRFKETLYARRYWILGAVLLFIFAVQLWVGFATRQTPLHDYGKVYNGAVIFATEGDGAAFSEYKDYFHHFTNNVGEFLILQLLFKGMHLLGLTCFYEVAVVLGHLLFSVAILCTFLYLDRAFGHGAALLSLVFWLCYLPVYFQSSIVYTDTFSIWVAPVLLYAYHRAKRAEGMHTLVCYGVLMGAVLGLGFHIKGSVLIVGVAIFLEMIFTMRLRRMVALGLVVLLVCGLVWAGVDAYAHAVLLEEERAEEAMPVTLWLLMGTTGDGAYNSTDEWVITYEVWGKEARTQHHIEVIKERLQQMGPLGYAQLLHRKTCRTFGSGNGGQSYMLVMQPDRPGRWIYQVIFAQGSWFRYFDNLSQAVYLSFYVFGIAGAAVAIRRRAPGYMKNAAPFWALLGFLAFMMLWESNPRQLVNQWPLLIIVASAGAALCLPMALRWLGQARRGKEAKKPA